MFRVMTAMVVATAAAAAGQILVRYGMQQVGALESWAPMEVAAYFWRALTNVYVIGGTVMNAVFYFIFLAVLSWSELTVALPLTALEYLFAAALSVVVLKEAVPALRWAGIALVVGGVLLIGLGESGPSRDGPRAAATGERGDRAIHGD
jgi:drug/metabolite transporter (DMT)-like permease